MRPNLKQYLMACKANRQVKTFLQQSEDKYEPVKVQLLIKEIKEIEMNMIKGLNQNKIDSDCQKSFQNLQTLMKKLEKERKTEKKDSTDLSQNKKIPQADFQKQIDAVEKRIKKRINDLQDQGVPGQELADLIPFALAIRNTEHPKSNQVVNKIAKSSNQNVQPAVLAYIPQNFSRTINTHLQKKQRRQSEIQKYGKIDEEPEIQYKRKASETSNNFYL